MESPLSTRAFGRESGHTNLQADEQTEPKLPVLDWMDGIAVVHRVEKSRII